MRPQQQRFGDGSVLPKTNRRINYAFDLKLHLGPSPQYTENASHFHTRLNTRRTSTAVVYIAAAGAAAGAAASASFPGVWYKDSSCSQRDDE